MKFIVTSLIFLISSSLWACPGCAGSMDDGGYTKIVYILAGFIALTYIPMFYIYKTIYKHRKGISQTQSDS